MRVAFIGPVGAGKTTQAQRLARALPHYNPRLSSGEIVRAHVEAGTELGRRLEARRVEYVALKERYEARGLLSVVDARRPIAEVAGDVLEALGHPERQEFYALGR
jgi:energy-coupling factor transporter ATP-binding protein EcfA2